MNSPSQGAMTILTEPKILIWRLNNCLRQIWQTNINKLRHLGKLAYIYDIMYKYSNKVEVIQIKLTGNPHFYEFTIF